MTQPQRSYVVVEPGAEHPALAGRAFVGRDDEDLGQLFAQVEQSAALDAARGRGPVTVHLELGWDTGDRALEARSRLLGTVAQTMLSDGGRLTLGAPPGRPLWMAWALAEWVRGSLLGAAVTVEVLDRTPIARAA